MTAAVEPARRSASGVVWSALRRVDGGRVTCDSANHWWEADRRIAPALEQLLAILLAAGLLQLSGRVRHRSDQRFARLTDTGKERLLALAADRLVATPRR